MWAAGTLEQTLYMIHIHIYTNIYTYTQLLTGWSAAMWAVLMVEQEQQMVGSDHGKRKELCSVINYLANLPAAQVFYVFLRICMCTYMYVYVYVCIRICMYTYMYVYVYVCIRICCMYRCFLYMYMHIYVYMVDKGIV